MAKFVFDTGDWANQIAEGFNKANQKVIAAQKMAIYEGANVIAYAARSAAYVHDLQDGLGIAKMEQSSDGVHTSVGFRKEGPAGYFTNRWGQTVPYDLAANVLEYGSSKVKATHFFSRAVKGEAAAARAVMKQVFLEQMNKYLGE